MGRLAIRSLSGLPEVHAGDDLGALIAGALASRPAARASRQTTRAARPAARAARPPAEPLRGGEIVVIAQKVVSKAEGAVVALAAVVPGARARELARRLGKDPRAVQVVLDQSGEVLRAERGVLICRTRHGLVCANAGVDASNTVHADELLVLPRDPDDSARRIRARLRELTGATVGVVITDSFGRAWRHGQCDVAIGCAGVAPLRDWRGRRDASGRELSATWIAVADALAAAAELAREKDSREPVAIVEGLPQLLTDDDGPGAVALQRAPGEALFR